jgi:hypothetical protein
VVPSSFGDNDMNRRALDLVFGLLLASGLCVGAVGFLGIRDWIRPQGEGAIEIYIYGLASFVPTIAAWLASGFLFLRGIRDRDVRLGAALATGHLAWWLVLIGLLMWLHTSPRALIVASIVVEPILYGMGATCLAVRWFRRRQREFPERVAATH